MKYFTRSLGKILGHEPSFCDILNSTQVSWVLIQEEDTQGTGIKVQFRDSLVTEKNMNLVKVPAFPNDIPSPKMMRR